MSDVAARVLVIEPNRIVRQGIRAELSGNGAEVVAEACNAEEALAAAARLDPDVVLLDSKLPDRPAPELCGALLERSPSTAIIMLSTHGEEASVRAAIESGARAYLLKDADDLDLAGAIERVLAGESVLHPRAAAVLIDSQGKADEPKLSGQELKVLRLVAEGLTNPEIGASLYLSRHTVKEYLSHAMRKLEVANRMEAVRRATELGLLDSVTPAAADDQTSGPETLVYNESGAPIRSSDLRVTPLKIDQLRRLPKQE